MGLSRIPASGLGPIGNSEMILVCAFLTIAFSLYLDRSWMGFAFRAMADDEQAARTLAIPVSTYKLAAFAIGTAIAGLAGGLYAYFTQFVVPDSFGFILSVTLMAMVVIGGAGSTWGVVAATIVLDSAAGSVPLHQRLQIAGFRRPTRHGDALRPRRPRGRRRLRRPEVPSLMSEALAVRSVSVRFGGVQALSDVSFSVEAGELVGLIGPNGAGKTTMLKVIAGVVKPDRGRVWLGGRDVTRQATAARVRRGLAATHQIVRPFRSMTTLDNVTVAAGSRHTSSPLTALFHRSRKAEEGRAADILAKVGLDGLEQKPASSLPLGHLKRLELARALATEPDAVILDEPLAGLNQREAQLQADVIAQLNGDGVTTILIEHNLREVLRVCKRLIVLDGGRLIADGRPDEVMARTDVREAYLGKGYGHAAA